MNKIIHRQLAALTETIAELKQRVRIAVAGELGQALSGAIQHVVRELVMGQREHSPTRYASQDEQWEREYDPWEGDHDVTAKNNTQLAESMTPCQSLSPAITAGVYIARWWLVRKGRLLTATSFGLGIGILGMVGGPIARTAVTLLAATADLLEPSRFGNT